MAAKDRYVAGTATGETTGDYGRDYVIGRIDCASCNMKGCVRCRGVGFYPGHKDCQVCEGLVRVPCLHCDGLGRMDESCSCPAIRDPRIPGD